MFFAAPGGLVLLCFVSSLLFSLPLSRAFSTRTGVAPATASRPLWHRLRWWSLLWAVAAVAVVWWLYPPAHHGSGVARHVGASGRFANAAANMLFFYCPLPYMLAVCMLLTPRCGRWRTLFVWTHLGGWAGCALAWVLVSVGLSTVVHGLYFELPTGAYNPGYPDFSAMLVYATALGLVAAGVSGIWFRRWVGRAAPEVPQRTETRGGTKTHPPSEAP